MIVAIDTSTAACTAALFDGSGACVARADEVIGRGHSERLAPMIEAMLAGRRATRILVGVGPGSFTGIRVGIAAAHGLAIGWDAELAGLSSLALLAAAAPRTDAIAAVMMGGHGELFVQQFGRELAPSGPLLNLPPAAAAKEISAKVLVGTGAEALQRARGWGEVVDAWPSASLAMALPEPLRLLAPRPLYARAPDARPKEAA